MGNLSEHFDTREPHVACRCGCGFGVNVEDTDKGLWQLLEKVRAHFGGKPVHINSCCRCRPYNRSVGSSDTSQHILGTAADFYIQGESPRDIAAYLEKICDDSCGIGTYSTFTHLDVRRNRARWSGK